mmetsp:Transcript_51854/g.78744  ORF Transcript_51854/g.78744 Transcript_51854/m.78744 type:complete len:81 (-) Transcript_51854:202-444(-)
MMVWEKVFFCQSFFRACSTSCRALTYSTHTYRQEVRRLTNDYVTTQLLALLHRYEFLVAPVLTLHIRTPGGTLTMFFVES